MSVDGTDRLQALIAKVGGPRRFATTKHKYVAVAYACEEHYRKVAEVIRTPLGPVIVARTKHVYQEDLHQPESEVVGGFALSAYDINKPLRGKSAQDTVWALDELLADGYTIAATSRCGQVQLTPHRIAADIPDDGKRIRVVVPHSR